MSKSKTPFLFPFDSHGNLMHWTGAAPPDLPSRQWLDGKRVSTGEWRENFEFRDLLVYDGYDRGRSACTFYWKSVAGGKSYPMFLSWMDWVLKHLTVNPGGVVDSTWTFCKHGANYSVRPVDGATP